MTGNNNSGHPVTPGSDEAPEIRHNVWRQRAEQAERDVKRLTEWIEGRDHQIAMLEQAIDTMHHLSQQRLEAQAQREKDNETLRTALAAMQASERACGCPHDAASGVSVIVPHLTPTLSAFFEVFDTHWSTARDRRPPKSAVVARALDEKIGWTPQPNGDPSRNAQVLAAAMRPDALRRADGRNHRHHLRD